MKTKIIDRWETVVKQTWFGWQIITKDQILKDFLTGDVHFWFLEKDFFKCSGGNAINWKLRGSVVTLTHQYADDLHACKIRLECLKNVIRRLDEQRKYASD